MYFLVDLIPFSEKHYHRDSFLTSNEIFDQGSRKRELWRVSQFQRLNWIKPANKKNYVDDFEWFRLRVLLRLYLVTLINMTLGFAYLFHRDSSFTTKKWDSNLNNAWLCHIENYIEKIVRPLKRFGGKRLNIFLETDIFIWNKINV